VLFRVLVALEAFEDVVGLFPARARGGLRGTMRAGARAADEHERLVLPGTGGQLADELGIGLVARVGLPLHGQAAGNPADVRQLRLGPHIHDLRAGLRKLVRFGRQKGAGVREA
jgi:hypothetical protein